MKISIEKAKQMLQGIFETTNAHKKDIDTIAGMLIEQELHKNRFSGFSVSEIETGIRYLKNSIGLEYEFVVDKPSVKLINGNGKSALLIGCDMVDMVCAMAKINGIAMVGLYNSTYHNIMAYYSRKIANQNLIALVFANGGPAAVVPHGGSTPIFGTNPFSYGIPTGSEPVVFDGATAMYAYGTILVAKKHGKQLPDETYLDKDGNFTIDPAQAIALLPFGGYKGYAINLMIDVLTGIMVRAKSGLAVQSDKDLGSLFIAIDPSVFGPVDQFKKEVDVLVADIQKVKPCAGYDSVYVPGYRSAGIKQKMLAEGNVEIDDRVWKEFEAYYQKMAEEE